MPCRIQIIVYGIILNLHGKRDKLFHNISQFYEKLLSVKTRTGQIKESMGPINITLTPILLTWRIWWAPNNASIWQMGFNSAFKGLKPCVTYSPKLTYRWSSVRINLHYVARRICKSTRRRAPCNRLDCDGVKLTSLTAYSALLVRTIQNGGCDVEYSWAKVLLASLSWLIGRSLLFTEFCMDAWRRNGMWNV